MNPGALDDHDRDAHHSAVSIENRRIMDFRLMGDDVDPPRIYREERKIRPQSGRLKIPGRDFSNGDIQRKDYPG
jgi:hypothetical protein